MSLFYILQNRGFLLKVTFLKTYCHKTLLGLALDDTYRSHLKSMHGRHIVIDYRELKITKL